MTVEQTSQLIQLILNSVLMVTICVVLWSALTLRHAAVSHQLRSLQRNYFEWVRQGDRLPGFKGQLHHWRQRYRLTQASALLIHYALAFLATHTLLMACRAVIGWQWLISIGLTVAVIGLVALLLSVIIALIDFQLSHRSFKAELSWLLAASKEQAISAWRSSHRNASYSRLSLPLPNLPLPKRVFERYQRPASPPQSPNFGGLPNH